MKTTCPAILSRLCLSAVVGALGRTMDEQNNEAEPESVEG
jgi:hypothetical protein